MGGLRKAAVLHYELFPELYQLARRASATGVPVLRPPALQYPDDERAWGAGNELLVGPNLLAAPVTTSGTQAHVYLPAGDWVDLGTGAKLRGPRSLTRPTPIDELPLYLRSGTAIPYNLRTPDVWQAPWGLNDLFREGRGGWVVAPGPTGATGDSADYGSVRASATVKGLRVLLTRAPRETEVVVLGDRQPQKVTIGGRPFARASSAAALRGIEQGWVMRRGRLGGVLLKLAPAAGRAVVTLTY